MSLDLLTGASLLVLGCIGGTVSTVSGGSFLFVIPALALFGFSPLQCLLLARCMIFPAFAVSGTRFFLSGQMRIRAVLPLFFGSFLGVACGALVSVSYPALFAAALPPLLLLSIPLLFLKIPEVHGAKERPLLLPFIGFGLGSIAVFGTSALGIFGPLALSYALGMDIRVAIQHLRPLQIPGMALVMGILLLGGVTVPLEPTLALAAGGLIGGYLGSHLIARIPHLLLKILIAATSSLLIVQAYLS